MRPIAKNLDLEAALMINLLGHQLNKAVFVSIPIIFNDDAAHSCKLVGIEVSGLWLESLEFGNALFPGLEMRTPPTIFVPFAQIRFLAEAFGVPPLSPDVSKTPPRVPPGYPSKTPPDSSKKKRG